MRKRVGIARAIILEPELVVYDEPTTGLDPIMSDVINELMLDVAATLSSHQCDRHARYANGSKGCRSRVDVFSADAAQGW